MKIILFIISMAYLYNIDWLININSTIEKINMEAILKKVKSIENENEHSLMKKYKLNDYNKIEYVFKEKFIDTFIVQYFTKGKFVFAHLDFIIAEYFHKGTMYPGRELGEITESREYFKNENEGINLRRSIDYYETSNIESLKLELQKMVFDTTWIGNDEYLKRIHSLKRIKKHFLKKNASH